MSYRIENLIEDRNAFPLPTEGKWEWIGGWRIKHCKPSQTNDSGWFFPSNSNDGHIYFDPASGEFNEHFTQRIRCRKWTRKRCLTSYPSIGRQTEAFLSLLARNASLTLSVEKLSDQLFDTHLKLSEYEEKYMDMKYIQNVNRELQADLERKQVQIHNLEESMSTDEEPARKKIFKHISRDKLFTALSLVRRSDDSHSV